MPGPLQIVLQKILADPKLEYALVLEDESQSSMMELSVPGSGSALVTSSDALDSSSNALVLVESQSGPVSKCWRNLPE